MREISMCLYLLFLISLTSIQPSYGMTKVEAKSQGYTCRSATVKHKFDVSQGFPKGRKGYVVDHICALANGGFDIVENMQYQNLSEGHKKDLVENTVKGRGLYCNDNNSSSIRTVYNCK